MHDPELLILFYVFNWIEWFSSVQIFIFSDILCLFDYVDGFVLTLCLFSIFAQGQKSLLHNTELCC